MNANELRIGSTINYNGKIITLKNAQELFNATSRETSFNYSPIRLNEEWLLKMGFEVNEFNTVSYLLKKQTKEEHTIYGLISDDDNHYGFYQGHSSAIDEWDSWTILKYVNAVNELQNLYWALTGEELTIKENT